MEVFCVCWRISLNSPLAKAGPQERKQRQKESGTGWLHASKPAAVLMNKICLTANHQTWKGVLHFFFKGKKPHKNNKRKHTKTNQLYTTRFPFFSFFPFWLTGSWFHGVWVFCLLVCLLLWWWFFCVVCLFVDSIGNETSQRSEGKTGELLINASWDAPKGLSELTSTSSPILSRPPSLFL